MAKNTVYKVTERKTSLYSDRERIYTQTGTLAELIDAYSYTLEAGKSHERERGCKKISLRPKDIDSLIKNLENAKDNCAVNGYSGSSFSYEIVPDQTIVSDQVEESYNINDKKQLYETIMINVSREIKKALNEMCDTDVLIYNCTKEETKALEEYYCDEASEMACEDENAYEEIGDGTVNEKVYIDQEYTLGGMTGQLKGVLTYSVEYTLNGDYEVMTDACQIEEYNLIFVSNNRTYQVELNLY